MAARNSFTPEILQAMRERLGIEPAPSPGLPSQAFIPEPWINSLPQFVPGIDKNMKEVGEPPPQGRRMFDRRMFINPEEDYGPDVFGPAEAEIANDILASARR